MSGAIIAAGRGERLRNAVGGIPKPLVELDGRPLLLRQIRMMQTLGINPIHVIINSETAGLMTERAIVLPREVDLLIADTSSSMESLLRLGERITPGQFLLATVDAVISTEDWRNFVERARDLMKKPVASYAGALGVVRWRGDKRPLFVKSAAQDLITYLGDQPSEWVTAGIYLFSTDIFHYAQAAREASLDALRRYLGFLIAKGVRIAALPLTDALDIDEEADLQQARAIKLAGADSR